MKVRLINNVFLDGEVREAGTECEIKDGDQLERLLDNGSVVDASTPLPEDTPFGVAGDVVEEIRTPNGDVYKKFDSAASGIVHTINDSEVVSEDAYVHAKQEVVQYNLNKEREANQMPAPEVPAEVEAATDQPPLDPTQPTQEQLEQDLANESNSPSAPSAPVSAN